MVNPYYDKTFFSFFICFFERFFAFLQGQDTELASDELQLLVLSGIAASSALIGVFLVLRRMTMLANALSHTILLGIVLAYFLTNLQENQFQHLNIEWMLFAAFVMGIITTFLTEFLTKTVRLQEDASIGLVFSTLFALGVILVTLLTKNAHIGTEVVMGNLDALNGDDWKLVYVILAMNVVILLLFFKEFSITTFDPGLSRSLGISAFFFNYLLMVQTAATSIGAFRSVGVLLVLGFLTGPALTARMMTNRLPIVLLLALLIGIIASFIGVSMARHLLSFYGIALSTAGLVVCVIGAIYVVTHFLCTLRKKWYSEDGFFREKLRF